MFCIWFILIIFLNRIHVWIIEFQFLYLNFLNKSYNFILGYKICSSFELGALNSAFGSFSVFFTLQNQLPYENHVTNLFCFFGLFDFILRTISMLIFFINFMDFSIYDQKTDLLLKYEDIFDTLNTFNTFDKYFVCLME